MRKQKREKKTVAIFILQRRKAATKQGFTKMVQVFTVFGTRLKNGDTEYEARISTRYEPAELKQKYVDLLYCRELLNRYIAECELLLDLKDVLIKHHVLKAS